jgi:hypothetical protein
MKAAYRRRDLAVEGFAILRRRFDETRELALHEFYSAALRLVAPKLGRMAPRVAKRATRRNSGHRRASGGFAGWQCNPPDAQ